MRKLFFVFLLFVLLPFAAKAQAVKECNLISAASNNATSCSTAVTRWYGISFYNTTTTVYYLRLYNLATAPTCTSATGFVKSIPIPPAAAAGQVGQTIVQFNLPVIYNTGLAFCLTGGSGSTDNTNAAVGVFGTLRYSLR